MFLWGIFQFIDIINVFGNKDVYKKMFTVFLLQISFAIEWLQKYCRKYLEKKTNLIGTLLGHKS